jgi:hypothetical protein
VSKRERVIVANITGIIIVREENILADLYSIEHGISK